MAVLGYAGLVPFYVFALGACLPGSEFRALSGTGFVVYGTVILAFLGGTLWGYAVHLKGPQKAQRIVLSNVVAVFAALSGMVGHFGVAVVLLAAGQLALLSYERASADPAGWYLRLRTRLTMGAMPAHVLFAVGSVLALE